MKRLIYFIALMLAINFAMQAQFITIKGKQFYDENGNAFYPLLLNYGVDMTYSATSEPPKVLPYGNPDISEFYLTQNYAYGVDNSYECDSTAPCLQQISNDIEKISNMGFNTIRVAHLSARYKPDTSLQDKFMLKYCPIILQMLPIQFISNIFL